MKKLCNLECNFFENIDLFGKEIQLYYKGKSKRSSTIGISFTIAYILLYLCFFIYKVVRMIQKVDVTFYDSYSFTGHPPKIKLSKDKFYGGFALGNPLTLQTFVDDSIYYVEAYYIAGKKEGNLWRWEPIPLDIETCQLDKFGEKYRDIFKEKSIDKLHCVPILDQVLEGHLTYDAYSYFSISFYPCINNTRNHFNCKPLNVIQQYLTQTFVTFKLEDVDLTPQIYDSPVKLRGKEVSANVGKSLFQDVHTFFQVVNIETDEDITGFEFKSKIKQEKYIKYDQSVILSSLKEDIFTTGGAICNVTIALSEQELTQIRTYPKLIVVLGDVGGLMEVLFSFFKIISSFLTETLYDISLVNHLFYFNLGKKEITIKESKKKMLLNNEPPKIYSPFSSFRNLPESTNLNSKFHKEENSNETRKKFNDSQLLKSKISNDNLLLIKPKGKKRKKKKLRKSFTAENSKVEKIELNTKYSNDHMSKEEKRKKILYKINNNNNLGKDKPELETEREKEENKNIINKIKVNKFYIFFCFCCFKRRTNKNNILLAEGMRIITEKLDIINIFRKINNSEKFHEKDIYKDHFLIIEMSDTCKNNLLNLKYK